MGRRAAGCGVASAVLGTEPRVCTCQASTHTGPRPSPLPNPVSCPPFEGRRGFLCSPLTAGYLVINTRLSRPQPNVLPQSWVDWHLSFSVATYSSTFHLALKPLGAQKHFKAKNFALEMDSMEHLVAEAQNGP